MKKQVFLIPVDFTDVTENAIKYALRMSTTEDEIVLLHIEGELNKPVTEYTMGILKDKYTKGYSGKITTSIVSGKIELEIGKAAESFGADLIIMGTHGEDFFQKIFGSKAIEVVSNSKTPFIVVQHETSFKSMKKIVMTIDSKRKSMKVIEAVSKLCLHYDAELVLVGASHLINEDWKDINSNIQIALKALLEKNIKCSTKLLNMTSFNEDLITYSEENDIDMIALAYYPDTEHLISGKFAQHLLNNKLVLPVLIIDAKTGV